MTVRPWLALDDGDRMRPSSRTTITINEHLLQTGTGTRLPDLKASVYPFLAEHLSQTGHPVIRLLLGEAELEHAVHVEKLSLQAHSTVVFL